MKVVICIAVFLVTFLFLNPLLAPTAHASFGSFVQGIIDGTLEITIPQISVPEFTLPQFPDLVLALASQEFHLPEITFPFSFSELADEYLGSFVMVFHTAPVAVLDASAKLIYGAGERLATLNLPDLSLPDVDFSFPKIALPQLSIPEFTLPYFPDLVLALASQEFHLPEITFPFSFSELADEYLGSFVMVFHTAPMSVLDSYGNLINGAGESLATLNLPEISIPQISFPVEANLASVFSSIGDGIKYFWNGVGEFVYSFFETSAIIVEAPLPRAPSPTISLPSPPAEKPVVVYNPPSIINNNVINSTSKADGFLPDIFSRLSALENKVKSFVSFGVSPQMLDAKLDMLSESIMKRVSDSIAVLAKTIPATSQSPIVYYNSPASSSNSNLPSQLTYGDFSGGMSTAGNLSALGDVTLGSSGKAVTVNGALSVNGVTGLTNADIPDGITASNYLPLAGGTLSGSTTINAPLTVNGALNGTNLTLSGTLTAGTLTVSSISSGGAIEAPYFTATSTTATSTFAGSVGIGTTTPSQSLSVQGNGLFSGNVSVASLIATGTIQTTGTATSTWANSGLSVAGGGLASANGLTITGGNILLTSGATSTFNNGLKLSAGCFEDSTGNCVGVNSDTLDSVDSLSFLRSDTSDNFTSGTLTFNSGTNLQLNNVGNNILLSTDSSGNVVGTSTPSVAAIFATSTTATSTFAGGLTVNGTGFVVNQGVPANSFNVNANGNVGIGTTSPATTLSVAGNGYFTGGLGVGILNTTANTFRVGQCVTGDTKLRRRKKRRKKNGEIEYDYDEIEIKNVKAGDEIASLDEHTGKIVWSKVKRLAYMGVKQVYKLTTKSGKTIRTTGNHPYLTRNGWTKVSDLRQGAEIACPVKSEGFFGAVPAKVKAKPRIGVFIDGGNMYHTSNRSGWRVDFAKLKNLISQSVDLAFVNYHVIVPRENDKNYLSAISHINTASKTFTIKEKAMKYIWDEEKKKEVKKGDVDVDLAIDVVNSMPDFDAAIVISGDSDYLALENYTAKHGKPVIFMGYKQNMAWELRLKNHIFLELLRKFIEYGVKTNSDLSAGATLTSSIIHKAILESSGGVDNSASQEILGFDAIASIEPVAEEDVYDIEIENTHNFVANGIIAHNTAFLVDSTGNVGIGTTSPASLLSVQGNGLFSGNVSLANLTATGTMNILGLTTLGNASTTQIGSTGSAYFATTNGNVGIGTTVPGAMLEVYDTTSTSGAQILRVFTPNIADGGYSGGIFFGQSSANGESGHLTFVDNATAASAQVRIGIHSHNDLMVIQQDGNVGIGFTAPSSKLVVSDSGTAGTQRTILNINTAESTTGTGANIDFSQGNQETVTGRISNVFEAGGKVGLTFSTYNSGLLEAVRINNQGNVGIGTTSPGTYFSVASKLDVETTGTTVVNIGAGTTGTDAGLILSRAGTPDWLLLTKGSNTPTGRFGIFDSAAGEKLTILQTTGNVGIGTTSPWKKLSVTGTVGFDGLTAGAGAGSLCLTANKEVVYSDNAGCTGSSLRFKHDIVSLDVASGIEEALKLRPVSFVYNDDIGVKGYQVGFIAEDVGLVDQRLITYDASGTPNNVKYTNMVAITIKAVQDVWAAVVELKDKVAALFKHADEQDSKINALEARVAQLEAMVGSQPAVEESSTASPTPTPPQSGEDTTAGQATSTPTPTDSPTPTPEPTLTAEPTPTEQGSSSSADSEPIAPPSEQSPTPTPTDSPTPTPS